MSNVKAVEMTGDVPFSCIEDEDCKSLLAQLNAPAIGLRIEYLGSSRVVPNVELPNYDPKKQSPEGKTAFYKYRIYGQEAVAYGWLEWAKKTIEAIGGTCNIIACQDLEA